MKIIKGRRFVLAEDFLVDGTVVIKKDAIVEALETVVDEDAKNTYVHDLSIEKQGHDKWYVPVSMLKDAQGLDTHLPIKKTCSGNCGGNCDGCCDVCRGQTKDKFYDAHYAAMAGLEPIEVMQLVMSREEFEGFLKGNIIKYTMRAGRKQGEAAEKDIAKAKRYTQWLKRVLYLNEEVIINPKKED